MAQMQPCSSLQTRLMYLARPAALLNQLSNFRPLLLGWEREEGGRLLTEFLKYCSRNLHLLIILYLIYTQKI